MTPDSPLGCEHIARHAARCQDLSGRLAGRLGLGDDVVRDLELLSSSHDIGKASIPDSILNKPGRLSPEEWSVVRKHPEDGYRMALDSEGLAGIADAIHSHHEWWDGSGYPQGLRGEAIPLLARIFAIIDAYDMMTQGTVYQSRISDEEAVRVLRASAGWQFDPKLVDEFVALLAES